MTGTTSPAHSSDESAGSSRTSPTSNIGSVEEGGYFPTGTSRETSRDTSPDTTNTPTKPQVAATASTTSAPVATTTTNSREWERNLHPCIRESHQCTGNVHQCIRNYQNYGANPLSPMDREYPSPPAGEINIKAQLAKKPLPHSLHHNVMRAGRELVMKEAVDKAATAAVAAAEMGSTLDYVESTLAALAIVRAERVREGMEKSKETWRHWAAQDGKSNHRDDSGGSSSS